MNGNAVKGMRTPGRCILFLGLMVGVLAAQNTATTRTTLSIAAKDTGLRTVVTLTAHVDATDKTEATEAPQGVVNFRSGDDHLDLGSAVLDAEGNASLKTDILSEGSHRLVAVYQGSNRDKSSLSVEVPVHANASTVAGFTVAASPTSLSTAVGGFVSSTITVTPVNGFNSVVSLSCKGLPVNATCSFTPVNVTATCTAQACTPATSVMQIQTLAPNIAGVTNGSGPSRYAFIFPALFGLAGLGAWKRRGGRPLALAMLAFAATMGMTACNARYYYLNHGPPGNTGTPIGTYTVTVEAESSTGSLTTTPPTQPQVTVAITAAKT